MFQLNKAIISKIESLNSTWKPLSQILNKIRILTFIFQLLFIFKFEASFLNSHLNLEYKLRI